MFRKSIRNVVVGKLKLSFSYLFWVQNLICRGNSIPGRYDVLLQIQKESKFTLVILHCSPLFISPLPSSPPFLQHYLSCISSMAAIHLPLHPIPVPFPSSSSLTLSSLLPSLLTLLHTSIRLIHSFCTSISLAACLLSPLSFTPLCSCPTCICHIFPAFTLLSSLKSIPLTPSSPVLYFPPHSFLSFAFLHSSLSLSPPGV